MRYSVDMEGDEKNIVRKRLNYFPEDECRLVVYVDDTPSFSSRNLTIPVKVESVEFPSRPDIPNKAEIEQNALKIKLLSYHGVYPPPIFKGDRIRAYTMIYSLQRNNPWQDTVAIELLGEHGKIKAEYRLSHDENTRYSHPITSLDDLRIHKAPVHHDL